MEKTISTRLSPSEGRRFAFPVGTAFLALGAFLWWKESPAGVVLSAMGAMLWAAGLTLPGRLTPVYRIWMAVARAISRVTTPIVMSVLYLGILTPVGLLRRLLGENPIQHSRTDLNGYWHVHRPGDDGHSDLTRQF